MVAGLSTNNNNSSQGGEGRRINKSSRRIRLNGSLRDVATQFSEFLLHQVIDGNLNAGRGAMNGFCGDVQVAVMCDYGYRILG